MERVDRGSDTITKDDLLDYLIQMRADRIVLDRDSLLKLGSVKWNSPVELAQFCFDKGFKAATEHLMRLMNNDEVSKIQNSHRKETDK